MRPGTKSVLIGTVGTLVAFIIAVLEWAYFGFHSVETWSGTLAPFIFVVGFFSSLGFAVAHDAETMEEKKHDE